MGIIEKLEKPDFKVTKSDKLLIEFIKKNLEDIAYKPITQIAKESNLGEATITRFARKMGFSSLQDFKVTLAQEVSPRFKSEDVVNSSIKNDESFSQSAKKLLYSNINVLTKTVDMAKEDDIHKCVNLLLNARRIFFIGIGYSGIVAEHSNYKFMALGLNCNSLSDGHNMIRMTSVMEENDLIIAISHSGETDEIIRTVKNAKDNNVKVIAITEDKKSYLKEISDVSLTYVSRETIFETSSFSSKLVQIFMIDLLYTEILKEKSKQKG